jgi:diguanylate cyclase (GGDEF)-like protein
MKTVSPTNPPRSTSHAVEPRPGPYPDPRQEILRHSLSIMTADSEDQLVHRTLAAAREATGAAVAVAIQPDGSLHTHGDAALSKRLADAKPHVWRTLRRRPGGTTTALADLGLPAALTATLGQIVLAVADPAPARLACDAESLLALLVAHAEACRERLDQFEILDRIANSDPLTGLRHNRPFEQRLTATAPGRTAVLAVDVDGFKKINDEYGHQAGDRALLSLVEELRAALRSKDELYRIGGDEFAVVVEVSGHREAAAIARRLVSAARRVGQTVSVGVAVQVDGETGHQTLCRADGALYEAKRAGRNTSRLAA